MGTQRIEQPHRDRRGEPLFLQQADLREDLLRRTVGNDGAVGEHDHAVGADALLHMVCDEHDRDALLTAELCRRVDHLAPSGRVEHGRRLVEHDALGLHGDDARDGDALLLPAGEQVRRVQTKIIHTDLPEGRVHARADLLRRHAEVLGCEGHIVLDDVCDDLVIGVLKDHAHRGAHGQKVIFVRRVHAVNIHLAAGRQQDGVEVLGERALAGAVVPEDGHERAARDLE